jgi:hypothetical protein
LHIWKSFSRDGWVDVEVWITTSFHNFNELTLQGRIKVEEWIMRDWDPFLQDRWINFKVGIAADFHKWLRK